MLGARVHWNAGMLVAAALLVVGGALMLLAGDEQKTLETTGLGIVVLAGVVYLGARIFQLVRSRRP